MPSAVIASDSSGPFDLIGSLPVHPLVIHAAVVLVPLAALGVLLMAAVPRLSRRLGWLVAAVAVVAAAACFVAKESGEALASRVGDPGYSHRTLGTWMPFLATALALVAVALWLVDRRQVDDMPAPRGGLGLAVAVLAGVVAVGTGYWVFRVGDSGARSVWTARVAATGLTTPTPTPSVTGSATPSTSPSELSGSSAVPTPAGTSSQGASATFTLAAVGTHNTVVDCWVVVGGSVYDLTGWIAQSPSSAATVAPICGTDASASFGSGADPVPAGQLGRFRIGSVAG